MTGAMTGSWGLAAGDHVCWRPSSEGELATGRAALTARAERRAGGLVLVGAELGQARDADSPGGAGAPGAALRDVRDQLLHASRAGRAPWVLASMSDLAAPLAETADVVALELELADLAAQVRTAVVCLYHGGVWKPDVLGAVTAVHTRLVGISAGMSGFRLLATGGSYALEGTVGYESVPAFTAALHGALIRSPHLTLCCRRLDLIEASAMRALVETVAARPGCSVLLEHAGETVRRTWELSGYGVTGVHVQVRP